VCLTPLIITPEKTSAAESEEQRTAKLVEGAKKEGNLLWYSATEIKDSVELLNGFKAKYPFINPSAGETFAYEFYQMVPKGVVLVLTSTNLKQLTVAELERTLGEFDQAAERLA